jgi:hypothetical protein
MNDSTKKPQGVLPPYIPTVPVVFPNMRPVNTVLHSYVYRDDETGGEGCDYWHIEIEDYTEFDVPSPWQPWIPGQPETYED